MPDRMNEQVPGEEFLGLAKKVTELVEKESDRGAILILAAYLEEILGLLVRAICVSDKLGQKLTELNKPAGDFDSKIILCVSLGLISEDEGRALRFVQKYEIVPLISIRKVEVSMCCLTPAQQSIKCQNLLRSLVLAWDQESQRLSKGLS